MVAGLHKLARNLWWTWDQEAQEFFRNFPRAAGRTFITTPSPSCTKFRNTNCACACRIPILPSASAGVARFSTPTSRTKTPGAATRAPELRKNPVAYFSAEFGFHETLPIAAGGLGILAGDHAKSASDLGLGFVGISLFYREGYFQQAFDPNNWQTEYYTLLNPKNLPIEPVLNPARPNEPLVCSVDIGMNEVFFQAWRVNVGRVPVYLLDTNRPENEQHFRDLTAARLWRRQHHAHHAGNFAGHRRRAVAARAGRAAVGLPHERRPRRVSHAGIDPRKNGRRQKFTDALAATKAQCIFTTHTPVEAGHDRFSPT